ncbi:MAG TPA: 5'-3' exonuclease H3TH domain-containing protein, partial [Bacillota bacterium]|nr:5'-3' exonuclease H3TH domain-containing protein [Bacillota bacterium]
MEGKMILLDSYSLANRAFFALPPLTNEEGQPTNAVYGVTMMLMRLIDEEKPDFIIAAFDAGKPTFRHEAYEAYKAGRRPMADELRSQIPIVRNLFETLQIPVLEFPGFEADDLLGTLSKEASGDGIDVYIVTGDRDAFQLVSPKVSVIYTKKGITDVEKVGPETLMERYQLRPEQMIELKGLMGDTSDNIPGVPGFGEKTALRLIQRFGDIPTLLENIDNLERPKEREL